MKKLVLAVLIVLMTIYSCLVYAGVNIGISGAVKDKIKKLDDKLKEEEKTNNSGVSTGQFELGSINISSLPSGAAIYLDGINNGVTPKTLNNVSIGNHAVKLTLASYKDWEQTTNIKEGETTTICGMLASSGAPKWGKAEGEHWPQYCYCIYMLSSTDGWTAGQTDLGIKIFHWDGNNWSMMDSPVDILFNNMYMLSSRDGWLVGSNNNILHWDGNNWTKIDSPYPTYSDPYKCSNFRDVFALSSNEVWIAGKKVEKINDNEYKIGGVLLCWDGNKWAKIITPNTTSTINSLYFVSSNDGWAVGDSGLILRYDGNNWSKVDTGFYINGNLKSVCMLSSSDVWAVGGYSGQSSIILHWNGSNWSQVQNPTPTKALEDIQMLSSNDGWAVGDSGTIIHWDGNKWSKVDSTISDNWIHAIHMISSQEGWAVGGGLVYYH